MKKDYHIILSSNSPRRKELLAGLDLKFDIHVIPGIDESYPDNQPVMEIAEYISGKKADTYKGTIGTDDLVITADTVVILGNEVLGKPKDLDDARRMLHELSGKIHHVVTGVCLTSIDKQNIFLL